MFSISEFIFDLKAKMLSICIYEHIRTTFTPNNTELNLYILFIYKQYSGIFWILNGRKNTLRLPDILNKGHVKSFSIKKDYLLPHNVKDSVKRMEYYSNISDIWYQCSGNYFLWFFYTGRRRKCTISTVNFCHKFCHFFKI
mgnify:CR=1 FL=1